MKKQVQDPNQPAGEFPRKLIIVDMTAEEESATMAQFSRNEEKEKSLKRQKALAQKWPDAFDLADDILNRGVAAVKEERDAIKQQNPKGEVQ